MNNFDTSTLKSCETHYRPRVFSISFGTPFLSHFVDALTSGTLIPNFAQNEDIQFALADTTIYVPTRRAARALRTTFIEKSRTQSSLLPTILPLGSMVENFSFFADHPTNDLEIDPPIKENERLLLLACLIRPWREKLPAHLCTMLGIEDAIIPTNTADAIWLAQELAHLMDEVETESATWSKLSEIAPDMIAEWWQITLHFLTIITQNWPQILKEKQKSNPAEWRNKILKIQADALQRTQSDKPIIAAGATGSIPAVANLLKVIASLPKGAVVLPGLDLHMDEAQWNTLKINEEKTADFPFKGEISAFSHPQYHLKKLLSLMECPRTHVIEIGQQSAIKKKRAALLSEALRPASTTDQWLKIVRDDYENVCADWSFIEATNEHEEALAISIALRHAIEEPKKTAALITNDRHLARRVAAELQRFGIEANDSGGIPLAQTLPVTLLRLLLNNLFKPGDPVAFLSLLKHPLTTLGQDRSHLREMVENFELLVLRGNNNHIHLCACDKFFETWVKKQSHHTLNEILDQQKNEEARFLCNLLIKAIEPLTSLMKQGKECSVNEVTLATIEVFNNFGCDNNNSFMQLYHSEAGKTLSNFLHELIHDQSGLKFHLYEWPAVFSALIAPHSVSPSPGGHARLFIWGTLESRLQTVDTVVMGGLNEGSWPITTRNDAFLSRPMKMALTLDPPEKRIGISAHDFQYAMGMNKVILSRAARVNHIPSVPSRWLQRLETVVGKQVWEQINKRGKIFLHWAKMIDATENVIPAKRPYPIPPLDVRPYNFFITEVETLRRNPYAIYAKKILNLKPLKPLTHNLSDTERGTLYHNILAIFCTHVKNPNASNALEMLLAIGRSEFDKLNLPSDIETLWWLMFENFAPLFIQWEQSLSPRERYAEVEARKTPIGTTGITLSGRADRLDILPDKMVEIIDFKTNTPPSSTQVLSLLYPQLALEAALLMQGAFAGFKKLTPSNLLYIPLKGQDEIKPQSIILNKKIKSQKSAVDLGKEAWERLIALMEHYKNPQNGYLAYALPSHNRYEGDYDHLARVSEWSNDIHKIGVT
ncbi:double-strand break repair protein AddB [Bartonella ancashensis]|uniref:ATP-dependent nuclease subunit B n=1 Tax=Bartonella ancashensis TaxID=1318743 RepID=A0A0M4LI36_9HYPH|nr:double-strand break repair protein AddB [Bartonella ancashensis]ALE03293.1 ATP-dependent nuclease subunit B [Bartonella ancashensis]